MRAMLCYYTGSMDILRYPPTYLVILTFVPKHGWKTTFFPKTKTLAAVIDFAAVVFVAIINNLARWRGRRKA